MTRLGSKTQGIAPSRCVGLVGKVKEATGTTTQGPTRLAAGRTARTTGTVGRAARTGVGVPSGTTVAGTRSTAATLKGGASPGSSVASTVSASRYNYVRTIGSAAAVRTHR